MAEEVKINDGGPAFPVLKQNVFGNVEAQVQGMTLRDWFAGQAMHFVLDSTTIDDARQGAEIAYMMADAMLAARLPTSTDGRETR